MKLKLSLIGVLALFAGYAYADGNAVVNAAGAITGASSLSLGGLLDNILSAVQGFGGLSWALKIAVVVMGLIGLMKVSVLNGLWQKLGPVQAWLAPILGLVLGVLMLGVNGSLSLAGVFAYMGSGAGAVLLHELLEAVKAIPGLGSTYVGLINMIEGVLPAPLAKKKPAAPAASDQKPS